MAEQHVHVDPEWETFTYGDPTTAEAIPAELEARRLPRVLLRLAGVGCGRRLEP